MRNFGIFLAAGLTNCPKAPNCPKMPNEPKWPLLPGQIFRAEQSECPAEHILPENFPFCPPVRWPNGHSCYRVYYNLGNINSKTHHLDYIDELKKDSNRFFVIFCPKNRFLKYSTLLSGWLLKIIAREFVLIQEKKFSFFFAIFIDILLRFCFAKKLKKKFAFAVGFRLIFKRLLYLLILKMIR